MCVSMKRGYGRDSGKPLIEGRARQFADPGVDHSAMGVKEKRGGQGPVAELSARFAARVEQHISKRQLMRG